MDFKKNYLIISNNLNFINVSYKIKLDQVNYLKIQNDQNLDDSDLILKKHENVELKKISEKNLERYFVYRYKFNLKVSVS